MSKLDDLDLAPRGATVIDLLGRSTADTWTPFGGVHSSHAKDWTPESGERFRRDNDEAERVVRGATRAEMVAWLIARGREAYAEEKRGSLRSRVLIVINELRYPREFVNEAPRVWHCSRCKAEGDLLKIERFTRTCGRCGAPSYAVQLVAQREWYAARATAKAG